MQFILLIVWMLVFNAESSPKVFAENDRARRASGVKYNEKCALYHGPKYSLSCADGSGCLGEDLLCDNFKNCPDGSDEYGCQGEEQPLRSGAKYSEECALKYGIEYSYICADDSVCLTESVLCDNFENCPDGSDEFGCHGERPDPWNNEDEPKDGKPYEFNQCRLVFPGTQLKCVGENRCVADSDVCDGFQNCKNNGDELDCGYGVRDENWCVKPYQQGVSEGGWYFLKEQMWEAHNYYRCIHGVPPIHWDDVIAMEAQALADEIAVSQRIGQPSEKYGINQAMKQLHLKEQYTGLGFVKLWYDEIEFYDFEHPSYSDQYAHFTQVVWMESAEVGCGIAEGAGSRDQYITYWTVCLYTPPGNTPRNSERAFARNVQPLL
ncbi:uncharacterized protein LOC100376522 [Saccoglossus kowalevskii]|uniref:Low-density lipoprotein receptor-related protein 1B-like n=1 Tax=Saccoglossus kowalevskii TaxID=10224 RepID=A0ABM0GRG9_SACKO|nr:PREDICTED: low-density lipoprotein receptor-related protein 1B-like [Saccoglossus kowalevskii]